MAEKIGRNDECWCRSGLKYKRCHGPIDDKIASFKAKGTTVPERRLLMTTEEIDKLRDSSKITVAVLDDISNYVTAGITTAELDRRVHQLTIELGGIPAPLNYKGFPKSCCISINQVVCHGIPAEDVFLRDGDIVNIDITTEYRGYFSDSSRMFCVGNVSSPMRDLVDGARECMEAGIAAVKPWGFLGDIGEAVSEHARAHGYTVVKEIGGHGIGRKFHEDPWVSYVARKETGMLLVPGLVFTVEPMINMGKADVITDARDHWTVYTADGRPSAQWEKTVLVTEEGCEILAY